MYQYGNVAVKYQNRRRQQVLNQVPIKDDSHFNRPVTKEEAQVKAKSEIKVFPSPTLHNREKLLLFFAVILTVAVLVLLMARAVYVTEVHYEWQALETRLKELEEQNVLLEMEIEELRSPERIITIAEQELGMTMKENSVKVLSHSQGRDH